MSISSTELLALSSIGAVQLLAVMSPGPSFLVTVRTAVARSRRDGLMVALGLGTGTFVWASATLLGLDALFRLMPWLFVAMKLGGALYLLWLAVALLRHAADPVVLAEGDGRSEGSPFLRGLSTQLANPKVVVFFGSIFVAMLPADRPAWMTASLLAVVTINEIGWYSAMALLFGGGGARTLYFRTKRWIDRATGGFLGLLGLRLLVRSFDTAP